MPETDALILDYLPALVLLGTLLMAALAGLILNRVVAPHRPDPEKLSPYECGFSAFDDAHGRFDIRFCLVAILFIIFDVAIIFLFPWALALKEIGWIGFGSMVLFLLMLTVGFIYEWKKGALEWD
ncbi:MAG: NADH-quinone oxidoreductase subunit A [Pseudomonadota bacterium]|nr:NADH-quinone oxidoreductase subunit A [Pseudomonadota bacterium]